MKALRHSATQGSTATLQKLTRQERRQFRCQLSMPISSLLALSVPFCPILRVVYTVVARCNPTIGLVLLTGQVIFDLVPKDSAVPAIEPAQGSYPFAINPNVWIAIGVHMRLNDAIGLSCDH